jgi:hypothetical protein
MLSLKYRNRFFRCFLALIGSVALAMGLALLIRDRLSTLNHLGQPIFAPFMVLVGVFAVFLAILNPEGMKDKKPFSQKRRHR